MSTIAGRSIGTVQVIKFHHLLSQLSPIQSTQFFTNLIAEDYHVIIQAIHNLIGEEPKVGMHINDKLTERLRAQKENENASSSSQALQANESNSKESSEVQFTSQASSKIEVQSKESVGNDSQSVESDESDSKLECPFDKLSCHLIGCVASWLNQSEFMQFSKLSRALYLGANDPKKLVSVFLDDDNLDLISPLRLSMFSNT